MPDNPTGNAPEREGENHGEKMCEEPFYEEGFDEEQFDPEEAERRITQFVTTADELPGPPSRNSPIGSPRLCGRHCATSRRSWRASPTTRCSPRISCWASEPAGCSSTTRNGGNHATERACCARRSELTEIQDRAYLPNATTCSVDQDASGRGSAVLPPRRTETMRKSAFRLPRITLPRTRVNKGLLERERTRQS